MPPLFFFPQNRAERTPAGFSLRHHPARVPAPARRPAPKFLLHGTCPVRNQYIADCPLEMPLQAQYLRRFLLQTCKLLLDSDKRYLA